MQIYIEGKDTSTSWAASLAGASLFALWGLVLISGEIPHHWDNITWSHPLAQVFFAALLVIPLVAVFSGWMDDFPRWCFPFLGHTIFFSLYMTRIATPGLTILGYPVFGSEVWGWRAWIPLATLSIVAILVKHSLSPLREFVRKAWQDWTLLTFAMTGILPLISGVAFDDIERNYGFKFLAALALLMTIAGLLYMRSYHMETRSGLLATEIFTTIAATLVCSNAYWQQKGVGHLYDGILDGVMIVAILLSPSIIGLLHRTKPFEGSAPRVVMIGQRTIEGRH